MEKLESHEIEEFHFPGQESPGIQLSVLGNKNYVIGKIL